MIEVSTDEPRRLVIVRMGGMMTLADVETFTTLHQDAVRKMGLRSGEFDALVIVEDNIVQGQEVSNAFARLVTDLPLKSRRLATVRTGVLNRMQSRRVVHLRADAAVFDDLAEANAWLAEP